MGDQLYTLKDGEEIPVEPAGTLATDGWLPGTWCQYSTAPLTFSLAMATVDISDGTGTLAGFLKTGPQHNQPVEELSDMWTTETRQRDGGSVKADLSSFDCGASYEMDENLLTQRVGTRIVTMAVPPTGFFKFYVFETEDLSERTVSGSGGALTYTAGDLLYVSNRGRLTSEMEGGGSVWTGYVVAQFNNDFEGNFVICVAAMV